jgi:hypothetical protein
MTARWLVPLMLMLSPRGQRSNWQDSHRHFAGRFPRATLEDFRNFHPPDTVAGSPQGALSVAAGSIMGTHVRIRELVRTHVL